MSERDWHVKIRLTPQLLGTADPAGLRTLVILHGELYEVVGWEPPNIIVAAPLPLAHRLAAFVEEIRRLSAQLAASEEERR